jgi:hypothetical protein
VAGSLSFCSQSVLAADFTVTSPGFFFSINGQSNPTLTLVRGKTYTFSVSTSFDHPFEIESAGVSNNNITHGTITYTVPTNAANYDYICSIHFFGGAINTVAPPAPPVPPTVKIVGFSVTTNLTIRSTGTSTWSVLPQFSTNLSTTNWYSLTVQTNRYSNGTNETICGRPPGNAVFIRVKAQQN